MPTASSRLSLAPEKQKVNLYCLDCEAQIGIFDNEWIRLTSSYARSKDDGLHFGIDLGKKTQVVPSGAAQKAAEGCTMVEVFCNTCHNVVGQYCTRAPSKDKEYFVDKHFYKLSRVFLKDTQAFHLVDPIFGFGGDLSQLKPSRSNRPSSGRWSETPASKQDQRKRSSQPDGGRTFSSPEEAQNGNVNSGRQISERPASASEQTIEKEAAFASGIHNGIRPNSLDSGSKGPSFQQSELPAILTGAAHVDGACGGTRAMSVQPAPPDYVIQYVPRHIYEERSVFGSPAYSRAASMQPLQHHGAQLDSTNASMRGRLRSTPADATCTPLPKTLFLDCSRSQSLAPQSRGGDSADKYANHVEYGGQEMNTHSSQMVRKDSREATDDQNELALQRIGDQSYQIGEHEERLNKLNDKLEGVQAEMRYITSILEDLRNDQRSSDTDVYHRPKLMREPDLIVQGPETPIQQRMAMEILQAENDDLKAKLDSIAQAIGISTPSPAEPGSQQMNGTPSDSPQSLGKRKRTDKYGPNKRSSLQHEVIFDVEAAGSTKSTPQAKSFYNSNVNVVEEEAHDSYYTSSKSQKQPSADETIPSTDGGRRVSPMTLSQRSSVSEPGTTLVAAASNGDVDIISSSIDGESFNTYDDVSVESTGDASEQPLQEIAESDNVEVHSYEESATIQSNGKNVQKEKVAKAFAAENRQSVAMPIDFSDDEEPVTQGTVLPPQRFDGSNTQPCEVDRATSELKEALYAEGPTTEFSSVVESQYQENSANRHSERSRSAVVLRRRVTDIIPDRKSRSMAPEPARRKRAIAPKPKAIDLSEASNLTPEAVERKLQNKGKRRSEPIKSRVQTTEKLLSQELEDLGLTDWIGKDKSTSGYRQAVDEARQAAREKSRLSLLAGKGFRATPAPEPRIEPNRVTAAPEPRTEPNRVGVPDLTTSLSKDLMGRTPNFKVGLLGMQRKPRQEGADTVYRPTPTSGTQTEALMTAIQQAETTQCASLHIQKGGSERLISGTPATAASIAQAFVTKNWTPGIEKGHQTVQSSQRQSTEDTAGGLIRGTDPSQPSIGETVPRTCLPRLTAEEVDTNTSHGHPADLFRPFAEAVRLTNLEVERLIGQPVRGPAKGIIAKGPAATVQALQNSGEASADGVHFPVEPAQVEAQSDSPPSTGPDNKSAAGRTKQKSRITKTTGDDALAVSQEAKKVARVSRALRAARRSSAREAQKTVNDEASQDAEVGAEESAAKETALENSTEREQATNISPATHPKTDATGKGNSSVRTRRQHRLSRGKDDDSNTIANKAASPVEACREIEAQHSQPEKVPEQAQQHDAPKEPTELASNQSPNPAVRRGKGRPRRSAPIPSTDVLQPTKLADKPAQADVLKEKVNEQDTSDQQQQRKAREEKMKQLDRMAMEEMAREEGIDV